MWNENKSINLSKICVIVFMVALCLVLILGPYMVNWLLQLSSSARSAPAWLYLITIYTGGIGAGLLLFNLYGLLSNISGGEIFTRKNVAFMRRISWFCFYGAFIALLSGIYYLPWGLVGMAAAFIGLIVRVVKNVVEQDVILKEENDYTI